MTQSNENARITFGKGIQQLINGHDLTAEQSYTMFRQVLLDEQPDLHQGAFLSALAAKGETAEEIAGAWRAIDEIDTEHVTETIDPAPVENSGTGMDPLKTFNVSSAAAIVAAAGGVCMARHGARALTSVCGTVDIIEAMGVDVECDVPTVERSIRTAGIGLFNGMSPKVHPQALGRILSQIRFGSTLNIAASLAHPCRPTTAVRGVYAPDMLPVVADVMHRIGYRNFLVVHGFDDKGNPAVDELSIVGATRVRECRDAGDDETYDISPEDVGLRRASYDEIAPLGDMRRESLRFLSVIAGRGPKACTDFTALNAAAVYYIMGAVDTLESGVEKATEILQSGKALEKLGHWVVAQNGGAGKASGEVRFESLLKAAEIRWP